MKHRMFFLIAMVVLVSASLACAMTGISSPSETPEGGENSATPEVVVVTATPDEIEATEEPDEASVGIEGPKATLKQDLNVRRGPGTGYAIITALSGGTTLDITGVDNTGYWWRVRLPNGQEGWVSASYTDSVNAESVTVVSAPPPPSGGGGDHDETPNTTSTPGDSGDSGPTPTPNDTEEAGGGDVASPDNDISTDLNIKGGTVNHSSDVSYPQGDSTDKVTVNVKGFDSITTSGDVVFTLTCSLSGNPPVVTYNGGSVTNGSPGCNSTWTVFFTNVSAPGRVTIKQESNGYTQWTLFGSGQE